MPLWQIIAAAIAVFAVFLLARMLFNGEGRIREVDHRDPARSSFGSDSEVLDPELRRSVLHQLHHRGKIHAIKELKQATGWGLRKSKDYVDDLELRHPEPEDSAATVQLAQPNLGDAGEVIDSLDPEVRRIVLTHVRDGRKINAIKELRDATRLGLKESKDIIDAIEAQTNG